MYHDYFGFRIAPFSVTPDPDLYYTNPICQEALASLQYGVSAKKGLIVVTGEVGTGKTTLLHRLLRNFGPSVHSIFIFNTQINFDNLLQLALEDLGLPRNPDERAALIETLNQYLMNRDSEGYITCLVIDEAQNLSAETLEGLILLSNLETAKEKLLQIVLVGQPELENKLDQPALRQLKQRVTLHCRLKALQKIEIGLYINVRLKAAGYEGESLFTAEAIERTAYYSSGIPRLINVICDNALLTAYALSQRQVSAELINEVAQDLRLSEAPNWDRPPRDFTSPQKQKEISPIAEAKIVPDEVWSLRSGRNRMPALSTSQPIEFAKKNQAGLKVGAFLTLLLFGSVGALIYSHEGRKYLSHAAFDVADLFDRGSTDKPLAAGEEQAVRGSFGEKQTSEYKSAGNTNQGHPSETAPVDSDHAPQAPAAAADHVPPPAEPVAERPKSVMSKHRSAEVSDDSKAAKRTIEVALFKAMRNRALTGVSVSFSDGIAYLDGEVATERQKAMAERAAQNVSNVKEVRNRLNVKRFSD